MTQRYYLGGYGSEDYSEVTKSEFIQAERAAGFHPKISSDHPDYMKTPATGGFSGRNIQGNVEHIRLDDDAAVNQYMDDLVGKTVELEKGFDIISEVGAYAEPGMKMRVTKFEWDDGSTVKVWFDQAEFLEANRAFESKDFIKRNADGEEYLVDAHEYGEYKPEDHYYIAFEDLGDYMTILPEAPATAPAIWS